MYLVYTNENRLLVQLYRNKFEQEGIACYVKNEFSAGAMGELSPLDTWEELWILDEQDLERARQLIAEQVEVKPEWQCPGCEESNPSTFGMCWNCGKIYSPK